MRGPWSLVRGRVAVRTRIAFISICIHFHTLTCALCALCCAVRLVALRMPGLFADDRALEDKVVALLEQFDKGAQPPLQVLVLLLLLE